MLFTFGIDLDDEGQAYVTILRDGEAMTIHGPMPPAATGPFIVDMKLMLQETLDRLLREITEVVRLPANKAGT